MEAVQGCIRWGGGGAVWSCFIPTDLYDLATTKKYKDVRENQKHVMLGLETITFL